MSAENYLERLVAEWYEDQGYFTWRNVRYGDRDEMDVVAFEPQSRKMVHVETTTQGGKKEVERINEKFRKARESYPQLFPFVDAEQIEQRAILWSCGPKVAGAIEKGVQAVGVREFLDEIAADIKNRDMNAGEAVPEKLPLLRTIQLVLNFVSRCRSVDAKWPVNRRGPQS